MTPKRTSIRKRFLALAKRLRAAPWDRIALIGIAMIIFGLQVWYLDEAADPGVDEGAHVEAARMIMEGSMPYRDFYYPHPPLLPLLIAMGLKLFGGMYGVRFVFLLFNTLMFFPLYAILKKLSGSALAALLAVAFFATFNEMLHHDFRFVASRQVANVFFICFAYLAFVQPGWKYRTLLQWLLASMLGLLLLPTAANLAFLCLAGIGMAATRKGKQKEFVRYATIGVGALAVLGLFFFVVPMSFEKAFWEHFGVPSVGRMGRLWWVINDRKRDLLFYGASIASLLGVACCIPRMRWLALCMLGMIAMLFAPAEFWPQYTVSAAFAFAVGFALLPRLCKEAPHAAVALLLAVHLWISMPSLWDVWTNNRQPNYYETVRILSTFPEPILTFQEPSYVIDAKKRIVQHYYRAARFIATIHYQFPHEDFQKLADQSCSIFLSGWDQGMVPGDIQQQWKLRYTTVALPNGIGFITNQPGCDPVQ